MKFKNFFKSIAFALSILLQMEVTAAPNDEIHAPIHHPDGNLAWSGSMHAPFHYSNYSIVWAGPNNPHSLFSYKNGQKAWGGYLYRDFRFDNNLTTVYHMNGQKAWGGVSRQDSIYNQNSAIYHNNGEKAWGGLLFDECCFSYTDCTLYHQNGTIAWGGASRNQLAYDGKEAYIYHSNGKLAWRGGFAKDGCTVYGAGIYYNGGELAWSGNSTDPLYDKAGNVITGRTDSINIDLGNQSTLHVHSNGSMSLFLGLGNSSTLIFTNQYRGPELLIALEYPAYVLLFSPHSPNKPARFVAYDKTFVVTSKK